MSTDSVEPDGMTTDDMLKPYLHLGVTGDVCSEAAVDRTETV